MLRFKSKRNAKESAPEPNDPKDPSKPLMEGSLYVSLFGRKRWKLRWCILYPDKVIIFKSSTKRRQAVLLVWYLDVGQFVQVVVLNKQLRGRPNAFTLSDFQTKHLFSGFSKKDTDFWYHGFGSAIKKLQTLNNWWETKPSFDVDQKYEERISSFLQERGENPEESEDETDYEKMAAIAHIAVLQAEEKVQRAKVKSKRIRNEEVSFLEEERKKLQFRESMRHIRSESILSSASKPISVMINEYKQKELEKEQAIEDDLEKLEQEFAVADDETFLSEEEERVLTPSVRRKEANYNSSNQSHNDASEIVDPFLDQLESKSQLEVKNPPRESSAIEDGEVLGNLMKAAEDELQQALQEQKKYEVQLKVARRLSNAVELKRKAEVKRLTRSVVGTPKLVLKEVAIPPSPLPVKPKGRKGKTFASIVVEFEKMDKLLEAEAEKMRLEEHAKLPNRKRNTAKSNFNSILGSEESPAVPVQKKYSRNRSRSRGSNRMQKIMKNASKIKRVTRRIGRKRKPSLESIEVSDFQQSSEKNLLPSDQKQKKTFAPTSVKDVLNLWQNKINKYTKERVAKGFTGVYGSTMKRKKQVSHLSTFNPMANALNQETEEYIAKEIASLIVKMKEIGVRNNETGRYTVKFGVLFVAYATVSDTLVGILMRAKKQGVVAYKGTLLFKGVHDGVEIQLLEENA